MKTISEYQPLLFSTLEKRATQRVLQRGRTRRIIRIGLPIAYALAAVKIAFDTGLLPSEAGFWMILAPVIAIGEYAMRQVAPVTR